MSRSNENSMSSVVKNYLEKTNRPYSANDVINNLSTKDNKVSKSGVTKALEELAANQLIKEKVNGKQKVYFADQNNFQDVDDSRKQQINQQLDQLEKEFEDNKSEVKQKESELSKHKNSPTLEQLSQKLSSLTKEVNELQNRLQTINSKAKDFDPELNQQTKTKRESLVTEWKKRKRMANTMIDTILEAYPKSKKSLIQEIGVETDEEFDVHLPQI